jgi:hypothetical protein
MNMTLGPLTFWPAAFWLVPPVLAVLVWLRFFRTRRQEIMAGSLLLWRRLAAQTPKAPPKRFQIDRALVLQALALLALITALAAPQISLNQSRGRALVLMVDNGPQSRVRVTDSKLLWADVAEKSADILRKLSPADTVFLARTAPLPKLLTPQGIPPGAALELLGAQKPALSGPAANAAWLFATDAARSLAGDAEMAIVAVSLQDRPAAESPGRQWLCVAPRATPPNVGLVDFGATPVMQNGQPANQILVRLRNFSAQPAEGSAILENSGGTAAEAQRQNVSLAPQSETSVIFTRPRDGNYVRIIWKRADGKSDALPEDDALVAAPRPLRIPRVRFHAPVPALEKLYVSALGATVVPANETGGVDLEIYAGSVPEKIPESSRAFLLLAPEAGYHSYFDVGGKTLEFPRAQRDEDEALTRGIGDKTESLFVIPKACELLKTGDFKSVVKDAKTERSLVARFTDEQNRPAFVLAFVPGAGLPPERLLEPELAAILVRMALIASGAGDPFEIKTAAALERASGEPLPETWSLSLEVAPSGGAGVLNEAVSALSLGQGGGADTFDVAALQPLERGREIDLRPWLIVVALALAAFESFSRRAYAETAAPKLEAK